MKQGTVPVLTPSLFMLHAMMTYCLFTGYLEWGEHNVAGVKPLNEGINGIRMVAAEVSIFGINVIF